MKTYESKKVDKAGRANQQLRISLNLHIF